MKKVRKTQKCSLMEIMESNGVVFDKSRPKGFNSFEVIDDDGNKITIHNKEELFDAIFSVFVDPNVNN